MGDDFSLFPDFEAKRYCFISASIPIGTLATISSVGSLAGAAIGAVGAITQGQAAKAAGEANAQIARNNEQIARQNATLAGQAGEQQAAMQEQKTRALVGALKANEAASGIDVNSGSALVVRSTAAELGELDAINIRSNAARTAYGYGNQATSFEGQANLDEFAARSAGTAGFIGAGSTLLGGIGNAAANWANFKMSNGLNPTDNGWWGAGGGGEQFGFATVPAGTPPM